jgi:Beta/Gamma crystallin
MIPRKSKVARISAMAVAAAATLTMVVPGTALAIDHIPCRAGENYLKIWSHAGGNDSVDCYANRGRTDFYNWWVDKISTGNNDLIYTDDNGDSVRVDRWHEITYPNRPPKVKYIEIL